VETRASNVRLMPFREPQPTRTIGLAWRSTSPLKPDFLALGDLIREAAGKQAE
jgi:LysR family hydrogen peroxide-inducible transcriptional activator